MTYKVILTKAFNKNLRDILSQGHKKIVQAVRASMTEAGTNGDIQSLPRTKHGESRLQNIEKYDLPDAYRLVVQLVNGVDKSRAFLFVGNHADADHWLDTHKNYKWVKKDTDGILDFVLVTDQEDRRHIPADRLDLLSPEELVKLPLLRKLTDSDWLSIDIVLDAKNLARNITGLNFEQDADGLFEKIDQIAGYDKASLLFDLMWHAHTHEWQEFQQRLDIIRGESSVIDGEPAEKAMMSADNSESFITFDDVHLLGDFFSKNTLADWMLFLHPEQKMVAERDFRGPARLRGVSGSGKTCVLVHRARYLAKKYNQPVLMVTLTESMRRLLDRLADDLCGVERSLIETKTMSMLAKDTLSDLAGNKSIIPQPIPDDRYEQIIAMSASVLHKNPEKEQSIFRSMTHSGLVSFLRDEVSYVRGRLKESEFGNYLDPKTFQRIGRVIPLNQIDRRVMLTAIHNYAEKLNEEKLQDHEGLVMLAIKSLDEGKSNQGKFRCILSDEVQDLSELDVSLLGRLKTPSGEVISRIENGLFLAGDGVQSIYKRGFSLRRINIDIAGRSFSLKKNYRNTHEILQAAFGLVSQYEFADIDEENIVRPSMPDFAKRHGAKPLLLRCESIEDEAKAVAKMVLSFLVMGQTPGQICVIGPNAKTREEVKRALETLDIQSIELRQDVDYESDNVKISTIESAKGHEFGCVFIMGLVEGILPFNGVNDGDLPREAARLYVAMTRAREKLTITYSPWAGHHASRFLSSIQGNCDEAHWRKDEVRRIE